ncbi:sensor domain-containing diguanylate cyclase [Breznakiella homolactica]|uniref:diguanylate cyclase n=1 Tax=Breznakiella homolactica TaxID=2798577 RepID=A0A7T7XRG3_9SPIR|nr:GGDEF domain-containing protein [Breznakiella homolactica]QQO11077.1 GGDEF domain-containing protein [Breznakiella homolactica]
MDTQGSDALEHIKKLINDASVPEMDETIAAIPGMADLHKQLAEIRTILFAFSTGDLSPTIKTRGFLAGCMKSLQAHLRHMVWQVQQVERGDFNQRVEFLGEFSSAFNSMVSQLENTLQTLQRKEETLVVLTDNLRNEVDLRNSAMEALQESETRFKYLASHDPLTGALNRRSFMERAMMELKSAAGHSIPCSIALMDIDHFKMFNDTHGHLGGDAALQHVVELVSHVLRKSDFMGRYGGEEFIFLFSNADLETSCRIVERIREVIASSPVKLESGNTTITASFGVTMTRKGQDPGDKNYIQSLINTADIALYRAKAAGRNQVVCLAEADIPGDI